MSTKMQPGEPGLSSGSWIYEQQAARVDVSAAASLLKPQLEDPCLVRNKRVSSGWPGKLPSLWLPGGRDLMPNNQVRRKRACDGPDG